jgi:hypothetical protein
VEDNVIKSSLGKKKEERGRWTRREGGMEGRGSKREREGEE